MSDNQGWLFSVSYRSRFAYHCDFNLTWISHFILYLIGDLRREFLCFLIGHFVCPNNHPKFTTGLYGISFGYSRITHCNCFKVIETLDISLNYLSTIVTLAPLLGLLGTISGMIQSFSVFNLQAGQPMAITGGIGEALVATATGLLVAILALVVHTYFAQRMDTMLTLLEKTMNTLLAGFAANDGGHSHAS